MGQPILKPAAHQPRFIPATSRELESLGWRQPDVILVTGDAYVDAPQIGVAVIGRVLVDAGYRVAIIAQPDIASGRDITRFGEPRLFWGVTAGCIDSMIANITASGKRRKSDDLTPGGRNTRRPNRAVIAYSNLIRKYFKKTRPIVLGGVEASLRRISHYDAASDSIRRSILFDAKADVLAYGMAERTVLELAERFRRGEAIAAVRGICYISRRPPQPLPDFPQPDLALPDHATVAADRLLFAKMFSLFYQHCDPRTAHRLYQRQDSRLLVHNPPQAPLERDDLDRLHELPFAREVHPLNGREGRVAALDTIRFSLTSHRGCYGECRFCAISVHQGRQVVSRSQASLLREAASFTRHPAFKGIISDVGGPTANMYGFDCRHKAIRGTCRAKACLFPEPCRDLPVDHRPQIRLLRALRRLPGIRKVFIASGIRYDLILADQRAGAAYLEEIMHHHVSGQLKIAPEHVQEHVLQLMGKPGREPLEAFLRLFKRVRDEMPQDVFLTYYLMAAHPGCTLADMRALRTYAARTLRLLPEQVQIFTPSPSTFSTLMYCTEADPFSGKKIFVEKNSAGKNQQKNVLQDRQRSCTPPERRKKSGAAAGRPARRS